MITAARSSVTGTGPGEDLAGLVAAGQVLGQVVLRAAEAAKVDDALHVAGRGGVGERIGCVPIGGGEVLRATHRVHQVVRHLAPGERRRERFGLPHIAVAHLNPVPPRTAVELARVASKAHHLVPLLNQAGYEPASDLAGGTCDGDLHLPTYVW